MLVLSRRLDESIVLPGLGVTVRIVAVKRGVVRLGIEAPPHVKVLREELAGEARPAAPARRSRVLCPS
jgi:carbon storage regulator CsrA